MTRIRLRRLLAGVAAIASAGLMVFAVVFGALGCDDGCYADNGAAVARASWPGVSDAPQWMWIEGLGVSAFVVALLLALGVWKGCYALAITGAALWIAAATDLAALVSRASANSGRDLVA